MTVDEYRGVLEKLTPEQMRQLRANWGGATKVHIEDIVHEFAAAQNPQQWESLAIFHLRGVGVTGLRTEAEKSLDLATKSANAAETSATAAEQSARSAGWSLSISIFSALIALTAVLVTIFFNSCWTRVGGVNGPNP